MLIISSCLQAKKFFFFFIFSFLGQVGLLVSAVVATTTHYNNVTFLWKFNQTHYVLHCINIINASKIFDQPKFKTFINNLLFSPTIPTKWPKPSHSSSPPHSS